MKLWEFNEILELTNTTSPLTRTLLIGNGFSKSISKKFDYGALLTLAKDNKLLGSECISGGISHLFDDLETEDFEKVIAYLDVAHKVLTSYSKDKNFSQIVNQNMGQIIDDKEKVKRAFIKSISYIHDNMYRAIGDELFGLDANRN
jgi:hypothetical protein